MTEQAIIDFFTTYAYQPIFVYGFIIAFMTASSFGLPIPEEITLLSAGLVAYMARHPEQYPPPTPDAQGVNLYVIALVCFIAVLGSDLLIYGLGKVFGKRLIKTKFFTSEKGKKRFEKINRVYQRYGHWGCGLFRFAPGVRFPGHLSCGMMGIPLWKFVLIDGSAALISVPTQVFLVAHYGEVILSKVKQFNIILVSVVLTALVVWLSVKLYKKSKQKKSLA